MLFHAKKQRSKECMRYLRIQLFASLPFPLLPCVKASL